MPDTANHPCFDPAARKHHARVHLPVAPRCNIQCRFCNRDFDCVLESRPGVTSNLLEPHQAAWYVRQLKAADDRLSVVGIAGPGDPFANPNETMQTLRLVHESHPDLLLCVATNGLGIGPHIDELADLNVDHVTVTVNAVDPAIGAKVVAWVRDGRVQGGETGAALLWERQQDAITRLKAHGITVKVNTVVIPGVNDDHVETIAKTVAALGADFHNCMPMTPVAGTPLAAQGEPGALSMAKIREAAEEHLPQLAHCSRCRADAAGLLGEHQHVTAQRLMEEASSIGAEPDVAELPPEDPSRPYIAVASEEGLLVNQHLGHASAFHIFELTDSDSPMVEPVEVRSAPPTGGGRRRWIELARTLSDCRCVLVAGAGTAPKNVLMATGLPVLETEGMINESLSALANGGVPRAPRCASGCGTGCSSGANAGMGCA